MKAQMQWDAILEAELQESFPVSRFLYNTNHPVDAAIKCLGKQCNTCSNIPNGCADKKYFLSRAIEATLSIPEDFVMS